MQKSDLKNCRKVSPFFCDFVKAGYIFSFNFILDMFLTQALAVNGFPFEIKRANPYEKLTEQEILDKLEKSREHAAQEMYRGAAEVSRDMRAKYGL